MMKQILRTLILFLVRILGAPGAYRTSGRQQQKPLAKPRILLIRPDHLGDLVLTTPVLAALQKHIPDASLTMMVGPWSSEVVARHPAIDKLITCPFPGFQRAAQKPLTPYILLFQMARQLKRKRYDLAINLRPDFWWGAALLYLTGIPQRIGYAIQPGQPFLTHALPFPLAEHATVSNMRLADTALQTLGYAKLTEPYTPQEYPLHFIPTEAEQTWVAERLMTAGITAEAPIIVIHPGTGAAVKLWRNEAWTHCANTLTLMPTHAPAPTDTLRHNTLTLPPQARIVLTGSPQERPMLEEIARGMDAEPLLISDMSVGQLAAVLARAQLVLGVDNGPLHLAVAQRTPTLQIFGPTDERIFGPWGAPEQHIIIRGTQKCPGCLLIPCGRLDFRTEELETHPCVRLVSEQQVEQVFM